MSRVRKGTTQPIKGGGVVIQTTGDGTLRGMPCPRCKRNVSPTVDAKTKKQTYACTCGSKFNNVRM